MIGSLSHDFRYEDRKDSSPVVIVDQTLARHYFGLVIGLAVAVPAARLVGGMLYGVGPRDFSILISMPVLLVTVVFIATYLPARRAMRVDPVISLRSE